MKPLICFICQTKCFFYEQNLKTVRTKHSKRLVIDFIRKLANNKTIEAELNSDASCACSECLDKLDVYDLAKSTVDKIELEFGKYLSREQSTIKSLENGLKTEVHGAGHTSRHNNGFRDQDDGSEQDDSMNDFNMDDDDESDGNDTKVDVNMYITEYKANSSLALFYLVNFNHHK